MKICSKCGAEHDTKQRGDYCPRCRREFSVQRFTRQWQIYSLERLYNSSGSEPRKAHLRFSTINDEMPPIPPRTLIYLTKAQHEYLRSIGHRYWLAYAINPNDWTVTEQIIDRLLAPSPHVLNSEGTGCVDNCPACAWSKKRRKLWIRILTLVQRCLNSPEGCGPR